MNFTVENLCGFLIRSKLMSPEEMKAMYQRWQADARDNIGSLPHFIRWLTAQRYVTEYQAALLQKGQADDFFLGPYKVLDRIGRGRMAGVYKAAHATSGQVVAIKVLPPSRAKMPQLLGRFEREARLSLKLKHPNVVRSFQVGEAKGLHWLVMECLDGETLEDVLTRRRRLPPPEAVRLVHQALLGLQHIHEMGMVHRDLKPANLMLVGGSNPAKGDVTDQATIKILDIGLARSMFDEEDKSELTAEGVLLGTPDYLSPEQARDPHTSDIRADIYSLGCVLYHCLTGQPPFPDKNILNQMVRHATETPAPIRGFNPQVPDGLEQIVGWMMTKDPNKRYPTPERAAQALQIFLLADAAPAQVLEETPQLKRYLTSLELDRPEADAGLKPAVPVVPATAAPAAAPKPAAIPAAAPPVAAAKVIPPAPASNPAVTPPAKAIPPAPASNPLAPAVAAPAKPIPPAPTSNPLVAAVAAPAMPSPPSSNPVIAAAKPASSPVVPAHKSGDGKHRRKKKKSHPHPIPIGKPAGAPPGNSGAVFTLDAAAQADLPGIDVELIPDEGIPWAPWHYGPREWILFGIGAGFVSFLVLVGFLFSLLFRGSGAGGGGVE